MLNEEELKAIRETIPEWEKYKGEDEGLWLIDQVPALLSHIEELGGMLQELIQIAKQSTWNTERALGVINQIKSALP